MTTITDYDYLFPGDVLETHCQKHGKTNHVWTGHKLICLLCNPDAINQIPEPEPEL